MSNQNKVLVIEDEGNMANFIKNVLKINQYEVYKAVNGRDALMLVTSYRPDVIILDLGLPDMDGSQIIKFVREWSQIPIIVISARTHERDKVHALDLGADDYMTKPFSVGELLARVRTAIRHMNNKNVVLDKPRADAFSLGELMISYTKRRVYIRGEEIKLTQTEFNLVALLCVHAGRVLTYQFMLKEVWGPLANVDNQILRVNVANIRRKFGENPVEPKYIFTQTGVGYYMPDGEM